MNGKGEFLNMTDEEYDLLDELYFIVSYDELKSTLLFSDDHLKALLLSLEEKKWIKCYDSKMQVVENSKTEIKENFQSLSYLATKAGLMAHNTR